MCGDCGVISECGVEGDDFMYTATVSRSNPATRVIQPFKNPAASTEVASRKSPKTVPHIIFAA